MPSLGAATSTPLTCNIHRRPLLVPPKVYGLARPALNTFLAVALAALGRWPGWVQLRLDCCRLQKGFLWASQLTTAPTGGPEPMGSRLARTTRLAGAALGVQLVRTRRLNKSAVVALLILLAPREPVAAMQVPII